MPSPKSKPLDLDAMLATRLSENLAKQERVPFILLGREWHATTSPSVVAVLAAMDDTKGSAVLNFLLSMIVPEEQADFEKALSFAPGMDGDMFGEIVNKIAEVIAGRPTVSPSASSRTSDSPKSGARSTARSSSVEDGDSLD